MKDCWSKDFPIVDGDEIRDFARLINDPNPIHSDHDAAVKAGLLGIIAPGVMTIGYASSAIAHEVPGVKICKLEMEFKNPLYAGSSPSVSCIVLKKRNQVAKVAIMIKNGFETIAKGSCLLLLPQ